MAWKRRRQVLADISRHVIQRTLNPGLLLLLAHFDAASNIRQALGVGVHNGCAHRGDARRRR